ncbi:hypothetical protein RJT34_02068 [Clitoria ternatea]|uniref:Cyclotide n=1 Tax=Clitoria ternatea TaxID=43366 RepID=A0AAN9KK24_CLITE
MMWWLTMVFIMVLFWVGCDQQQGVDFKKFDAHVQQLKGSSSRYEEMAEKYDMEFIAGGNAMGFPDSRWLRNLKGNQLSGLIPSTFKSNSKSKDPADENLHLELEDVKEECGKLGPVDLIKVFVLYA